MMLRLIIGIVLIAHGIGHSMGFLASWTTIPSGLTTGHWILSSDITMDSTVGRIFGLIWLLALAGLAAAGIGLIFQQSWWQTVAVVSSIVSLVAILPWLNLMPLFSAIGAVLVDLAVLLVLLTPLGEQVEQVVEK
jgi:hypothetical protein